MEYYRLYGFWVAVALAFLLPIVAYFVATAPIKAQVDEMNRKLDETYKQVKSLDSPTQPNDAWIAKAKTHKEEVAKRLAVVSDRLLGRQEQSLQWMEAVRSQIPPPPLPIDRTVRISFRTNYEAEAERIWRLVDPSTDENPTGKVSFAMNNMVLQKFTLAVPTTEEVRLAQEDLWIQEALLRAIAEANRKAASFHTAVIKRIDKIQIGGAAADGELTATKMAASSAGGAGPGGFGGGPGPMPPPAGFGGGPGPMPGASDAGGASAGGVRYVEDTERHKLIPVQLVLVVDPMEFPKFFEALSRSPLSFLVSQVSMKRVTGLGLPTIGELSRGSAGGPTAAPGARAAPRDTRAAAPATPRAAEPAAGEPRTDEEVTRTPDLMEADVRLRLIWYKKSEEAAKKEVEEWERTHKPEPETPAAEGQPEPRPAEAPATAPASAPAGKPATQVNPPATRQADEAIGAATQPR